jgi:bifunctional non-homologous end joining protein LigD
MTALVPELAAIPAEGVFDGELVAFTPSGHPSWPLLCKRVLRRDGSIPVTFVIFDVLELDGEETSVLPYMERRRLLDSSISMGRHGGRLPCLTTAQNSSTRCAA